MSTFTTLNKVSTVKGKLTNEIVIVSKVQKDGTKRVFFKVEKDGKLIVSTMFGRLYDAERTAKNYLNR